MVGKEKKKDKDGAPPLKQVDVVELDEEKGLKEEAQDKIISKPPLEVGQTST